MVNVCFYFQVHQPYRIAPRRFFDIGASKPYFDEQKNKEIMKKVAEKCYLPMNKLLLDMIEESGGEVKVAFSISGVALEQMREYAPEVLESFKRLAETSCVEFLSETYYHSLSFLYSREEFEEQVKSHENLIRETFGQTPKVFRNTELVYSNDLAQQVEEMGYKGVLAEGWDDVLGWQSPNFLHTPKGTTDLSLLMKNYKLSDDIAFRFSNQDWEEWPLTAEKFLNWVDQINGSGEILNLFMDYETFGEHQWEDTGIFDFMRDFIREIVKSDKNTFITPSKAIDTLPSRGEVDVPHLISWADAERDLSAWLGNDMQAESLESLFQLEEIVKNSGDDLLIRTWRLLTISDHFYYMSTKYWSDGDVHKYFSAYESPYEAYIYFMNLLNDFMLRLKNNYPQLSQKLITNNET